MPSMVDKYITWKILRGIFSSILASALLMAPELYIELCSNLFVWLYCRELRILYPLQVDGFGRRCCSIKSELCVQNLILVWQPVRHCFVSNSKKVHDMKTKELDFCGCGKPQPLQMSWMCWANRLLSRMLEQMSCSMLCQVAGSDRVMSVECNVWCYAIDVHTVCISGIFFFVLLS